MVQGVLPFQYQDQHRVSGLTAFAGLPAYTTLLCWVLGGNGSVVFLGGGFGVLVDLSIKWYYYASQIEGALCSLSTEGSLIGTPPPLIGEPF